MHRQLFLITLLFPLSLFADSFRVYLPSENQHLVYRSVAIMNASHSPQQLREIYFNALPEDIEVCTADSSCLSKYQNTCTINSVVAPNKYCLLWFRAKTSAQFSTTTEQPLTIRIVNSQQESTTQTFRLSAHSEVFAAGIFTQPTNHIARWDGHRWLNVGEGLTGGSAQSLVEYEGDIIVGGDFTKAGKENVNFLARWDGRDWHPLQHGIGDPGPSALTVYNDSLFVGGGFNQVNGNVDAHYLASFYEENWTGFKTGLDFPILSLAGTGQDLYLAGDFHEPALQVGLWRYNHVEPLGAGMDDVVFSLAATVDGTVYAGGAFDASGSTRLNHIGQWNGQQWLPLGEGLSDEVYALAINGTTLYAGGKFAHSGAQPLSAIALWDGHNWHALAGGVSRRANPSLRAVYSIASTNDDVFVGGYFNQANNINSTIPANHIAHWQISTQTWQALGEGLNDTVYSIVIVPVLDLSDRPIAEPQNAE